MRPQRRDSARSATLALLMSTIFSAVPASVGPFVRLLGVSLGLGVGACGGSQAPADAPATPTPAASAEAPAADGPLTAARCEAAGGKVVGDIGDGAIHRPEYRCASGKAPLGKVVGEAGQPVAIEGSVCCP